MSYKLIKYLLLQIHHAIANTTNPSILSNYCGASNKHPSRCSRVYHFRNHQGSSDI